MKIILPYKGFDSIFFPCAILSLDIENVDPLFLNAIFVKMISELQDGFQQFLYFKI